MKGLFALSAVLVTLFVASVVIVARDNAPQTRYFTPPDDVYVTYFSAPKEAGMPLVISATVDAGFMRPFLLAFQRHNPAVSIVYIQSRSGKFLKQALDSCHLNQMAADIYLSASTDQLMRLANENCAQSLPAAIGASAPGQAQWRNEVVAFAVEPAAFVFSKSTANASGRVPTSHIALLDWLRKLPPGSDRIGTYDIVESADGYNFAASDSRQAALYGRVLEGLGRSDIRLYCCSNVMVDAVARGEIRFAYNVQLSYAYAAQRAGSRIEVVVPRDYQALQTLSFMVPVGARTPGTATKLAAFLVSDEARALARDGLVQPGQSRAIAMAHANALLDKAWVTPLLLSLQDHARRNRLISEWRQAIVSPAQ
ncbi:ABC transporter substrate-binding protein [Sphingobium amiense]|uniref:ABC transporter substrate-binding protein n=1 Tax=Sphingobium amiense TaxID=135719 RepID=A0A494VXU4_9SPHN|nr:extracellular solute-binding protein [Sphingobium amiense]BBD97214.1 ABC transporter substrate-binding protein [Sphingobium amiense]